MKFKNIAVLGDNTFGDVLGKKGTESDITLYSYKEESQAISFVVPTEYPGKVQPMAYAINMTDAALVKVDAISRTLGEIIVALECAGIKKGYIVMGENLIKEQVLPLIKGTVLQNYKFIDNDRIAIMDILTKEDISSAAGITKVPIDHFFDVKSV
ncbi:MAG: elongation factor Tu, partial [Candidatus Altiarchaeales archaeon HGW-Altiarchaeales-1]